MLNLLIVLLTFIKALFSFEPTREASSYQLRLNLQFFAEDPDDDEDLDDDDDDDPATKDKPFAQFKTKEELNKRISRAEKSGQKALAKQLGFDSVEAMQLALKKPDVKDPLKKDNPDEPVDVAKMIEAGLKDERAKAYKRILNSEVKVLANELGFADYEDALALADLSEVKENDKGDLEGVKEALEALATKKPHLLKSGQGGNFGGDIIQKRKGEKEHLENIKKLAQNRGSQASTVNDPWKS